MDFLKSSAAAYLIVGILTCITTIIVNLLNRKFSKKIKPEKSTEAGYTEWVAYLERELQGVRNQNKELVKRVTELEQRLFERETLIQRMRNKLLEFSRKYNEDVSTII